jgi:ornithine carbamoyltransferase
VSFEAGISELGGHPMVLRTEDLQLSRGEGEEITGEVLYGSRQRIWDQAENRRHGQKALLELLVVEPRLPVARPAFPGNLRVPREPPHRPRPRR